MSFRIWISILFSFFLASSTFASSPIFPFFFDVSVFHKNFPAISELKNKGIIQGYADGTFHPDQLISRAEAIKILLMGSQVSVPQTTKTRSFPDVSPNDWFAPSVQEAKSLKIIKGREGGNFEPNANINRAEALKMLILVNGKEPSPVNKNIHTDVLSDSWYAPYFQEATARGIFDAGENDFVHPSDDLTRGELAEMMYRYRRHEERKTTDVVGVASWYNGRNATEEPQYTGAHRTREMGSKIKVTDENTGKSVVITIDDRGPFLPGRILDISRNAFEEISSLGKGVTLLEIEDVSGDTPTGPWIPSRNPPEKEKIPPTAWDGIQLNTAVVSVARKGETKTLTGTANGTQVRAFFKDPLNGKERLFSAPIINSVFTLPIFFENPGKIDLGIILGDSGTSKVYPMVITDQYDVSSETQNANPAPQNVRVIMRGSNAVLQWDDTLNNIFHIQIRQQSRIKNLFVSGSSELVFPRSALDGFSSGMVLLSIAGAYSPDTSSLHLQTRWSGKNLLSFPILQYFPESKDASVTLEKASYVLEEGKEIFISGKSKKSFSSDALVIFPNGDIEKFPLKKDGEHFSLTVASRAIGTHVIEISGLDGIELLTLSAVPEGFFPILPNAEDRGFEKPTVFLKDSERDQGVVLVNSFRIANGILPLKRESSLDALAQMRADDMVKRNYFSHTAPDNTTADDLRLSFGVKTPVLENIATGMSIASSSFGLENSASHRKALLNANISRVGIGIAVLPNTNERVVVQIFAGEAFASSDLPGIREEALKILAERRGSNALLSDIELEGIGNSWSTIMAEKGEHSFSFASGESIEQSLKKGGVTKESIIFVGQLLQKEDFFELLKTDTQWISSFLKPSLREIGIGLFISPEGVLFVTLIGTE